ncbi:GNAT family N-acetyltransferase [Anaerolineales bacterium HSG6]|nr:GNAT family N-acetyltransferase [Anaerolineales bacterium HSG6]MDM8532430.1 GNAT family N-acetyltransferase [Anaerolineales bacterium HSG25]
MTYLFAYKPVAQALYASLNRDPFYTEIERAVSNDPIVCKEALLKYFDFSMQEGQKHGELYIPEGKILGTSIWVKPMDNTLAQQLSLQKKSFIHQYLGQTCLQKYAEIVDFMSNKAKDMVSPDSWYLSIIAVAPQFRGQGLGSTLIRPILAKTDDSGVATYLETFTPRNREFYHRLGYREVMSLVEPMTGSKYWLMMREPQFK